MDRCFEILESKYDHNYHISMPFNYSHIYEAMEQYAKEWEDKYKEANQFICDLGKLLGQDGLGFDDLKWSLEDFRDAIDEKKKEMCLELLEYMAENVSDLWIAQNKKPYFKVKGQILSKEQLFENFL